MLDKQSFPVQSLIAITVFSLVKLLLLRLFLCYILQTGLFAFNNNNNFIFVS